MGTYSSVRRLGSVFHRNIIYVCHGKTNYDEQIFDPRNYTCRFRKRNAGKKASGYFDDTMFCDFWNYRW